MQRLSYQIYYTVRDDLFRPWQWPLWFRINGEVHDSWSRGMDHLYAAARTARIRT